MISSTGVCETNVVSSMRRDDVCETFLQPVFKRKLFVMGGAARTADAKKNGVLYPWTARDARVATTSVVDLVTAPVWA